jgi:hypothetical protein
MCPFIGRRSVPKDALETAAVVADRKTIKHEVVNLAKTIPCFKRALQDATRKKVTHATAVEQIDASLQILTDDTTSFVDKVEECRKCIPSLSSWNTQAREGSTRTLEEAIKTVLDMTTKEALSLKISTHAQVSECDALLRKTKPYAALLDVAFAAKLGCETQSWRQARVVCGAVQESAEKVSVTLAFAPYVAGLDGSTLVNEDVQKECLKKICDYTRRNHVDDKSIENSAIKVLKAVLKAVLVPMGDDDGHAEQANRIAKAMDVISGLQSLIFSSECTSTWSSMIDSLATFVDVSTLFETYRSSAEDVSKVCANDIDLQKAKVLRGHCVRIAEQGEMLKDTMSIEVFDTLRKEITDFVDEVVACQLLCEKTQAAKTLNSEFFVDEGGVAKRYVLKDLLGGMRDGSVWTAKFKSNATFAMIRAAAVDTVDTNKPSKMQPLLLQALGCANRYDELLVAFSYDVAKAPSMNDEKTLLDRGTSDKRLRPQR